MVQKIGDWPDNWDVYDLGERSGVDEEVSDGPISGEEAFRAVPPDLEAAVQVERIQGTSPGEGPFWFVSAQDEAEIFGGGGDVGYKKRWPAMGTDDDRARSQQEAEELIADIVADYRGADSADDVGYL